jgi:hypothetical protein
VSFCPHTKKNHNRRLLFCSTILKHGHHVDYWNQPLNMHLRVCCLDFLFFKKCIYTNVGPPGPL